MNASFTKPPSPYEHILSNRASRRAQRLVQEYGNEVSDAREWPNRENVENTWTRLLAYIAALEQKL